MTARLVLVSGLSGAGRSSILRTLEDLGYEAVDNPPMPMLADLAVRYGTQNLAIGVDVRSQGFDVAQVLALLDNLRARADLRPELIFATADETTLLRRFTETRRRHPLAPQGRVADGIAAEIALTRPLRANADLVIDTSDLALQALRQTIEQRFGRRGEGGLTISLISFAFPAGLPREADMVFDARFLRNPHYDPVLKPHTGLDADVGAYVEADPDYRLFFDRLTDLLDLLLPRFIQEGKKYATIAVGCTGGRHRSVHIVERLAQYLSRDGARADGKAGWKLTVTHRELDRLTGPQQRRGIERAGSGTKMPAPQVQAREA